MAGLQHLFRLLGDYAIRYLTPKRLKDCFLYCVDTEKMGERKMNGKINVVRPFFDNRSLSTGQLPPEAIGPKALLLKPEIRL